MAQSIFNFISAISIPLIAVFSFQPISSFANGAGYALPQALPDVVEEVRVQGELEDEVKPVRREAPHVTEVEVRESIRRAVAYLYQQQNERGTWDDARRTGKQMSQTHGVQYGGVTALVSYALLTCGEDVQANAKLKSAIDFLEKVPMTGTYAMGFRAHVWALLPKKYEKLLVRDMNRLVRGQATEGKLVGTHHYHLEATSGGDHSVTQYGMLGIWEAAKRGHRVPKEYWQRLEDHFLACQNLDGGWGYEPNSPSRGSMTVAGLTALYITQDFLHGHEFKDLKTPPAARVAAAITQGQRWLDQHHSAKRHPQGSDKYLAYYLLGVERVGEASGVMRWNGEDWYRSAAAHLIANQNKDGSWGGTSPLIETAFVATFLARGLKPVAMAKLAIPGQAWNERPRDAAQLTDWLSEETEVSLGWQVVDFAGSLEQWQEAPLVYWAGRGEMNCNEVQIKKIRAYLNAGGLLVTNAVEDDVAFTQSMEKLAGQLYPDLNWQAVGETDGLYRMVYPVDPKWVPMRSLNNGVRHLMVHLPKDVSLVLHERGSKAEDDRRLVMGNLYHYATNKGVVQSRLQSGSLAAVEKEIATWKVTRVKHAGRWDPEPGAWKGLVEHLRATQRVALEVDAIDIAELDTSKSRVAHLGGVSQVQFDLKQAHAFRRYVEGGGWVIVECVGGDEAFEKDVSALISGAFPKVKWNRLSLRSDMLDQRDRGGDKVEKILYRRCVTEQVGVLRRLRMKVWRCPRPGGGGVIFSADDLSSGWLPQTVWGIQGYHSMTSKQLMRQILRHFNHQEASDSVVLPTTQPRGEIPSSMDSELPLIND